MMDISVSIDKFDAVPDAKRIEVELQISGVKVRILAEDALVIARKIELAATEAIGVSA